MAKKDSKPIGETKKSPKANYVGSVILHISDLHFQVDSNSRRAAIRTNLFNDLIDYLKNVPPQWKPNILCITGDIAYRAKREEYKIAQDWISKLLSELNIRSQNVVLCPGNHDVDVVKAGQECRPKNTIEANNKFLDLPIPSLYEDWFSAFTDFCTNLNLPSPTYGDFYSYLFGIRQIDGLYFLVCNSCWFFKNIQNKIPWPLRFLRHLADKIKMLPLFTNNRDNIEEKMWLGLPLFEYLDSKIRLLSLKKSNLIIALLHHPERYLHEEETARYPDNTPTIEWIKERTDLIISGHSHSLPLRPKGQIINCGAGFKGKHDRNVFCLIKIEAERCLCQFYTSDQSRSGNKWEPDGSLHKILFSASENIINTFIDQGNSLHSLYPSISEKTDIAPKQPSTELKNPFAVTDEPSGKSITTPIIDIPSVTDNLEIQMAKARNYLDKFEYEKSFLVADDIINKLTKVEPILPTAFLAKVYLFLADIEITRVNWRNITRGITKDFTRIKELYQKSKEYHEKG